ncbi:hypothetical protein EJ069_21170 [Mesorhizobium sp. M2A.F.Ca.ET.043.05.1.1]|nr:hypothetical protein EJ069_21170 [Mesorhizobium sp. M2A.F.Ca.ET.043.05.1.1]
MKKVCARPPSLSCRTSPPQGGRLAVLSGFANLQRVRIGEAEKLLISPLEGEMSGRTERGAKDRDLSHSHQRVAP